VKQTNRRKHSYTRNLKLLVSATDQPQSLWVQEFNLKESTSLTCKKQSTNNCFIANS